MRLSIKHPLYERDVVWVQYHPQKVRVFRLGSLMSALPWMMSSVIGAAIQTRPDGRRIVAVREDNPMFDFQPGKLALEAIGVTDESAIFRLSPEDFDAFATVYVSGVNNTGNLAKLVPVIQKYVPAMQFMPPHLHRLLEERDGSNDHNVYQHLPRFFMKFDLSEYEVILWLDRGFGQISPKKFPDLRLDEGSLLHLGGAWYACRTLDEAMMAKFTAPATEIHRLREDDAD
jgi:hypothetical protein